MLGTRRRGRNRQAIKKGLLTRAGEKRRELGGTSKQYGRGALRKG